MLIFEKRANFPASFSGVSPIFGDFFSVLIACVLYFLLFLYIIAGYSGHESMMATMHDIVTPAARRFRPDMIIVSAGYDAHVIDPFQLLQMRSSTYHAVSTQLRALADELCAGRLLFLLEGGYDVDALGESVAETWLALLGQPSKEGAKVMELPQPEPLEEVDKLLHRLKKIHKLL